MQDAFKINIELSLNEASIEAVKRLIDYAKATVVAHDRPDLLAEARRQLAEEGKTEAAKTPIELNVEEVSTPDCGDLPEPEITNDQLFVAVKAAQKERKVAPATVKALFAEFGITSSRDCPQDRRVDLLNRINAL